MFAYLAESTVAGFITLGIFVGMTWIFEGFMAFGSISESTDKARGWVTFTAIISVLAGFSFLCSPFFGSLSMWFLIGAGLLVMGITKIVRFIIG